MKGEPLVRTGLALAAIAIVASILVGPAVAHAGEEVVIVQGKSQVVQIPFPIGQGENSNPRVVQASVDLQSRRVTFFGRTTGSATYRIYDARQHSHLVEFEIRVVGEDLGRLRDEIERQIGDIEGVNVKVQGDQVVIDGDVATEPELARVNQVAAAHKGNVINLVRLSPLAVKALARTIEQNIGRPEVTARPLKDKILLEGQVYTQEQKTRAESIATTLYSNVVNVIEVVPVQRPPSKAKTIVINTHFLELSKELVDSWSINWGSLAFSPGGVSAFFQQNLVNGQITGDFNSTISGTVTAFLPKFERAKPEGIVRTLANPVITTKDGQEAKIFSGAEVPLIVGETANGVPIVTLRDVGIGLNATPYAQGDSVDLKIDVNVSDLGDVNLSGSGAGILKSNFTCSQFTRAGESVAIGGLFRVSDNVIYNKMPKDDRLNDSIFQLFLSRQYQKRKGQFIIFITPSIYDDSVGANRVMKDYFNLQEVGQNQ